jgi:hypothetical protein
MKKSDFIKKVQMLMDMEDEPMSKDEVIPKLVHIFEKAGMIPPQTTKKITVRDPVLLRATDKFVSVNEWDDEENIQA